MMDILTLIGISATVVGIIAGVIQVLDYLQKRHEKAIGATPEMITPRQEYLSQVRRILTNRFDEGEIQTLCFDLGVDYDILPGDDKADKVRELIKYLERRKRVSDLVETGQRLRPDIAWQVTLETLPQQQVRHNLPPRTEFIGRESEKSHLHEALCSRSRLVSIDGIGGIGKTALALEVAHECLHASQQENRTSGIAHFDGFIWVTAKDRELDLDDLLDSIARTLDYPGISQRSPEEKQSATRKLLRAKSYLLIVDNMEAITDDCVHKFLNELPEPSKALITTRKRLSLDARMFSLEDLNQTEALALMRSEGRRLGLTSVERAGDQVLLRLYQSAGGAPLGIKWAVGQIRQKGQSLETVLRALRKAEPSIFDNIFAHSWKLLSQDAQRVIVVMPLFATSATQAAIEAVSDVHIAMLDQALGQLVEMSLLDVTDELELAHRRYSIHPLTRAYAALAQESTETSQFVQKSFQRMLEYYRRLVTPPEKVKVGVPYWDGLMNYAGVHSLEQEWPNLNQLIRRALREGRDDQALNLFLPIVHLLNAWGLWDERLELSREMCAVANRLGDPSEAWLWIDAISWILAKRHQFRQVVEALEKGRQAAERLGLADALIQADAYEARLSFLNGNFSLASQKIESVLTPGVLDSVLKHSSQVHQIVIARMVNTAGTLKQSERKFVEAKRLFERELNLRRSIGENVAPVLARLGYISILLDEIASAETFLDQATPNAVPKDIALINYSRALIAQRKGQSQEARHLSDIALDLYTRLGMENEIQECQKLLAELPKLMNHRE